MSELCKACRKKMHEYEYHNEECGLLLCQTCVAKICKHYIEGLIAEAEIRMNTATIVRVGLLPRIKMDIEGEKKK